MKIGFIGAGKMAEALIKSILKSKISDNIIASDINENRLKYIEKEIKIKVTKDNKEVVENSDIVFLAVKPQNIKEVLNEIEGIIKKQLIVSIAAGIDLNYLESKLNGKRIIRIMPNTPCLVGEMAAGFSLGKNVKDDENYLIEEILNSAGNALVLNEDMLDGVTALSGSGPAFIAYLLDAMIEGAIKQGLNKDAARELAFQTALGTGKLMKEQGLTPKELIDMVSSPNGTTEAGMEILKKSDIRDVLIKTIEAAAKRSKEVGKK